MKVIVLCANWLSTRLENVLEHAKETLQELEVQLEVIQLDTLPYYIDEVESPLAQIIANKIAESRGVIGMATVHTAGMHSSMHSFFEHIERYTTQVSQVPFMAVTYTKGLGERQAAYQMLQAWSMIGGNDAGYVGLNEGMDEAYMIQTIEKAIEGFYRTVKQERKQQLCSEALLLRGTPITHLKESTQREKESQHTINLSTQEQNIQEFTELFARQTAQDEVTYPTGISAYERQEVKKQAIKKERTGLARLPHYFVAQYAKDLDLTVQFIVSDTREQGYIMISGGDCTYEEGVLMSPMLEITLTQALLQELLSQKITYQKAFMIGRIKVKGNFILVPKLDQLFKPI